MSRVKKFVKKTIEIMNIITCKKKTAIFTAIMIVIKP